MLKRIILLFFVSFFLQEVQASHVVGGEFFMVDRRRGFQYQLGLRLYFDDINCNGCGTGGLGGLLGSTGLIPPSINVGIYEKNTNVQMTRGLRLERISYSDFVPYESPECAEDAELRTRILLYSQTITLDPAVFNSPNGYYVVNDLCCRNEVISNIEIPDETGMRFYMEFPAVIDNGMAVRNTSPQFNMPFAEYACKGTPFTFDFSAEDPDGDSLVYYMTTPFDSKDNFSNIFNTQPSPAPNIDVRWLPGFDADNAVTGNPTLDIGLNTGKLTVTPTQEGLYVFSVNCDEYRDGEYLGRIKRDFQLKVVAECKLNRSLTVSAYDRNLDQDYVEGDTLKVSFNTDLCFDVYAVDSIIFGEPSTVTLTYNPVNFSSGLISATNTVGTITETGDTLESEACMNECADSKAAPEGVYILDIYGSDNGCPQGLKDTLTVLIEIEPIPNTDPEIFTSLSQDTLSLLVNSDTSFTVFGTDADNDLITLSGSLTRGAQFPSISDTGAVQQDFYWKTECIDRFPGFYSFTFKVDDKYCGQPNDTTKTIYIEVSEETPPEVPFVPINIFTPNGDGINDVFFLEDLPIETCDNQFETIEIFNRWGARVFASDTIDFVWDGNRISDGTYYYHIKYTDRTLKGWVQLMR